jgi:Bacteriophage Sf6, terminase small subunit-like
VSVESIPRGEAQRPSKVAVFYQVIERMQGGESAAAVLRELKVNRGSFWKWLHHRATPPMLQRYKAAVQARAHSMIDETIDIADQAQDSEAALNAKIAIEARWRAASKYDPHSFGEASRSECSETAAGALIDDSLLQRIQEHYQEHLLDQKPKVGRPSRARGPKL